MLAKRVIPTMLCRGRTLVKGERFAGDRSIGHVLQAARVHARRQVDELLILDIAATAEGRGPDLDLVRELSKDCFIPITVGGGVKTLNDIDQLLRAGADKVAIGAAAYAGPLVFQAAKRFGSQAIVCAIDAKRGRVVTHCGAKAPPVSVKPEWWARFLVGGGGAGAGEILLTAADRDGTMEGYDLMLVREVTQAVDVPVIASGGCSGYADMHAALAAGADAVAAGALFAFTDATPKGAAQYLQQQGWEMRT